jgi:biotin transport system substrate-specific component
MQSSFFRPVLSALFTALIVVGAYIAIPFVPVPLVLANFFALLAGLLLGPFWGGVAVLLYLVLGTIGLPVFAGGTGGFAHFLTPTGGFLLGYLAMAVIAGLIARGLGIQPAERRKPAGLIRLALAGLAGVVVLYAVGLPWFQAMMGAKNPQKFPDILAAGLFMAPYLVGDLVKVAAAVLITRSLRPLLG